MQGTASNSAPWPDGLGGHAPVGLGGQVIAHAPMGIAVLDADGCYTSVNPAYCRIYGYGADELLGSSFTRIVPVLQQAPALARHRAFLSGGAALGGELVVVHRDGQVFNVQVHSVAVPGADGRLQRLVYVLDISQRLQTERALRQALETQRDDEALLLDMAASIPGAMFRLLQQPDGHWRFTYFSPGITALCGLMPAQACADIGALGRLILPDDRAAHDTTIRAAVAAGLSFEQEYRIRSTGGMLKWVHCKAVPKPGVAGAGLVWTGMLHDISERRHMETVLRSSEERYRTLFETVAQGVVYQDAQGRISSANPAAQRILGRTLVQMQVQQLLDPAWQAQHEDGSPLPADQHPCMRALRSGQPVNDVVMGVPVAGRGCVWLLISATPVVRQGLVHEVYSSFEDITERVRLSQELKLQASTDYLTGVANRRSLMQRLALEFEQVKRPGAGHRCAVLAVDLDLFKQVNDRHGHATGDAVLQQVAAQMRRVTRQHDLVARSGGEEFMLLLPDTGVDDALALAERLRTGLRAQPLLLQGLAIMVTLSVGVSLILPGDASPDTVLARADAALYRAKAEGRDRVCLAPLPD